MKYFGFIKEHDNIPKAVSIKDLMIDGALENTNRETVVEYLKGGALCIALMGCIEDANDPNLILMVTTTTIL